MPVSRPIRSVTNCPSTTSDERCSLVWTKACILSYESASDIGSSHSLDTQQFGLAARGGTKYGAAVLAEKWLSPKGAGTVAVNLKLMKNSYPRLCN